VSTDKLSKFKQKCLCGLKSVVGDPVGAPESLTSPPPGPGGDLLPSMNFVNPQSQELFLSREHALLGISPFNSYYSEVNLKRLFRWALNNFKKINVFIPDEISTYTLQAIGYSLDKAQKKTRLHDNNLKNKAIRALLANDLSVSQAKESLVLLGSNLSINNSIYIKFFNTYTGLYETDERFREGCLASSKVVLASKGFHGDVNDEAASIAVKYFIAELPIYFNTSEILNISSSLYVYKDPPSAFLTSVYNNENSPFNSYISYKQGYMAVDFIE
jgi:cyclo(L-tyrosyl-L-tyrosyl) synthase